MCTVNSGYQVARTSLFGSRLPVSNPRFHKGWQTDWVNCQGTVSVVSQRARGLRPVTGNHVLRQPVFGKMRYQGVSGWSFRTLAQPIPAA
jgi:hypothetical protein